jgi:hypothetical protein
LGGRIVVQPLNWCAPQPVIEVTADRLCQPPNPCVALPSRYFTGRLNKAGVYLPSKSFWDILKVQMGKRNARPGLHAHEQQHWIGLDGPEPAT